MTPARQGPALRIEGTCEGCAWLHAEERVSQTNLIVTYVYHCGEPSQIKVHPLGTKPRKIGRKPAMPSWCPEQSAARLALGRELVAAGEQKEGEER